MKEYEFFENYVKDYDMNEYWIKYKYDHTYRVIDFSKEIANSLSLSKKDKKEVEICALFHDIARFSQYQEFKSFKDIDTFDHGDRGVEILKENGYTDELLLKAVKYHNKYEIPAIFDERTKLICKVLRDADKLDILNEVYKECTTKNYILPDEILAIFKKHKTLDRKVKLNVDGNIEYMLKHLAFIFDLNFKYSFKFIKDNDIINERCNSIYKNNKYEWVEELRNICNEFIESRLNDERIR